MSINRINVVTDTAVYKGDDSALVLKITRLRQWESSSSVATSTFDACITALSELALLPNLTQSEMPPVTIV